MTSKYTEIELKYDASKLTKDLFFAKLAWNGLEPTLDIEVKGPDEYWTKGDSVIRFRSDGDTFRELTTKQRTSKRSTKVRKETDLKLAPETSSKDIESFLQTAGYKKKFVIIKEAVIQEYDLFGGLTSVVYYEVYRKDKPKVKRTFIEIEGSKKQTVQLNKKLVKEWSKVLIKFYPELNRPLNSSLFEIFS